MTDLSHASQIEIDEPQANPIRRVAQVVILVTSILLTGFLLSRIVSEDVSSPLITESTFGQLGSWVASETTDDEVVSLLGGMAQDYATQIGQDSLTDTEVIRFLHNIWTMTLIVTLLLLIVGGLGAVQYRSWAWIPIALALIGLMLQLLLIPSLADDNTLLLAMLTTTLAALLPLTSRSAINRITGFLAILAIILVAWETAKAFAASIDYQITLPVGDFEYTTYPTLDEGLLALESGDIDILMEDRKELDEIMAPFPADEEVDAAGLTYPDLRYADGFDNDAGVGFLPIIPEMPGRITIATSAQQADSVTSIDDFGGKAIGVAETSFAYEKFIQEPRNLVLINLRIFNNINLPHLQDIAEALLQPARRNGDFLLVRILGDAGLYTWGEAVMGFIGGAILGFILGSIFAHSNLLERGLLPYVVASQTVPILAIAPMVVIWLGASAVSVAVIAAYLTFFPVTINTLRGLQSPNPIQVELMNSYAATRMEIFRKLRLPAALPYIFTALKVSATASVVGSIIGELPSGIRDGLGRAILDFSSDYSLTSTPKLWSAIVVAAVVGIVFFLIVSLIEQLALRGRQTT